MSVQFGVGIEDGDRSRLLLPRRSLFVAFSPSLHANMSETTSCFVAVSRGCKMDGLTCPTGRKPRLQPPVNWGKAPSLKLETKTSPEPCPRFFRVKRAAPSRSLEQASAEAKESLCSAECRSGCGAIVCLLPLCALTHSYLQVMSKCTALGRHMESAKRQSSDGSATRCIPSSTP